MFLNLLRRLVAPREAMSASWLKAQERDSSRIDFEGVSIRWPINKLRDASSPIWNARKLKRRA